MEDRVIPKGNNNHGLEKSPCAVLQGAFRGW